MRSDVSLVASNQLKPSSVVFNITVNMARARILLMNEDETKLASLSQCNLLMDIKVHLSCFLLFRLPYVLVTLICSFFLHIYVFLGVPILF